MRISRKQAVLLIKNHNLTPDQQTDAIKGELVEKGSSFNEVFGVKENYNSKEIFTWLGY